MIGFLETIFRAISFWIDSIVYSFIPIVYNLLIDIAETTVFTDNIIELFANRVYGLLGIFMLFKVSFSVLSYIVNPDDFTDKNKGFSKIIQNVLITLVLLVLTPTIFTAAMNLQRIILKDNIIGKLILGTNSSISSGSSTLNPGNSMSYETLKAFYFLDYDLHPECKEFVLGTDSKPSQNCLGQAFKGDTEEFDRILTYSKSSKSVSLYLDWSLVYAKNADGDYSMEYKPIFSSVAGVFMVLILLSFCFEVAVRSVKLGFLRMIAPVPIISRVDPKKGKELFGKWVKTCISTYMDLFIRLAAIYFAVFVITQVLDSKMTNAVTGADTEVNFLVKVFIILGALLFAKEIPKLVEDLLGIKLSGKFEVNPLKQLNKTGVPAAFGAVGGAVGAGIANAVATKPMGKNPFENMTTKEKFKHLGGKAASGIGGFGSGLARGSQNFIKNKGEKPIDTFKETMMQTTSARVDRDTRQESGITAKDRIANTVNQLAGIKNKTGGYGLYNEMAKQLANEETMYSQQYAAKLNSATRFASDKKVDLQKISSSENEMKTKMAELFNNDGFKIRTDDFKVDNDKQDRLNGDVNALIDSVVGGLSSNEKSYITQLAYAEKDRYNQIQTGKFKKDATDLTESVNQAAKK